MALMDDPAQEESFMDYLREWLKFEMSWMEDMNFHIMLWGVPCGPTLSMVEPRAKGIM